MDHGERQQADRKRRRGAVQRCDVAARPCISAGPERPRCDPGCRTAPGALRLQRNPHPRGRKLAHVRRGRRGNVRSGAARPVRLLPLRVEIRRRVLGHQRDVLQPVCRHGWGDEQVQLHRRQLREAAHLY